MKPLATDFEQKGFELHLVERKGDIALFERKRPDWKTPQYEVIRVKKYPTYDIGGATVAAHEAYPGDSGFGKDGWSTPSLKRAREIFDREFASNPYTNIAGVATGGARGRVRDAFEIEIPQTGQFTVKELAEKYQGRSVPFIHLRLNELIAKGLVKLVEKRKIAGAKGKPTNVYQAVPLTEISVELV